MKNIIEIINLPKGEKITRIEGDLFDSDTCLAHCISMDYALSKGIAKTFRDTYRDNFIER